MKTYPVLKPVNHDGVLYDKPDTIALEDGAAAALHAVGTIGAALEDGDEFGGADDDEFVDDAAAASAKGGRKPKK